MRLRGRLGGLAVPNPAVMTHVDVHYVEIAPESASHHGPAPLAPSIDRRRTPTGSPPTFMGAARCRFVT